MSAGYYRVDAFGGINDDVFGNPAYASLTNGFAVGSDGSLFKGPGFTTVLTAQNAINSVWCGALDNDRLIAYTSGSHLFLYSLDYEASVDLGSVGSGEVTVFKFGGKLYILTGSGYYSYSNGGSLTSVEGYIPLVAVSTSPGGAGTAYEAVNMLTAKRRQQFSPDGSSTVYKLCESGIASVNSVTVGGTVLPSTAYTVNTADGTVTFVTAPAEGLNTVEITYSAPTSSRSTVLGCSHAMQFGSNADVRTFLWGNPSFPSYRFHSELADGVPTAEYFPVNAYTVIGSAQITDIVQQYDKQLIFTTEQAFYSYCEVRTSLSGAAYTSFPVYPLNPVKGNLISGCGCSYNGMPVTLCADGINVWQSTDVETEKNAVCISSVLGDRLALYTGGVYSSGLLFNDTAGRRLIFHGTNEYWFYNYARGVWYRMTGTPANAVCGAFGKVFFALNDKRIVELTDRSTSASAQYRMKTTDFGAHGAFQIASVKLTLTGGAATAGTVTAAWHMNGASGSATRSFSLPASRSGDTAVINIPLSVPPAENVVFTIASPQGKDLCVHALEFSINTKGDIPFGL